MIINNTKFEDLLKSFLQKKVSFELNNKIFKIGRILLFTQKYFYVTFILNTTKKKQEKLELPIPFNFEINKEDNQVYLDYRVSTLAYNNKKAFDLLNLKTSDISFTKNKFFNKILTIQIINE